MRAACLLVVIKIDRQPSRSATNVAGGWANFLITWQVGGTAWPAAASLPSSKSIGAVDPIQQPPRRRPLNVAVSPISFRPLFPRVRRRGPLLYVADRTRGPRRRKLRRGREQNSAPWGRLGNAGELSTSRHWHRPSPSITTSGSPTTSASPTASSPRSAAPPLNPNHRLPPKPSAPNLPR